MTRTDEKVRYSPQGKEYSLTPTAAARGVEDALKILEGHWKLVILFHLFGGKLPRLSEPEDAAQRIKNLRQEKAAL